jgi:hypothetical protein
MDKVAEKTAEIRQLKERIAQHTSLAVQLKQEGELKEALQTLRHIKVMKVELATNEQLLAVYLASLGEHHTVCSLAVLQFEIGEANARGDKLAAKNLRKQARTIRSDIETDHLTQSQYVLMLEAAVGQLKSQEGLSPSEAKHLELMEAELMLGVGGL